MLVATNLPPLSSATAGCPNCQLREPCLWGALGDEVVGHLSTCVRTLDPEPKGTLVCRQGAPTRSLFALRSGSAKATLVDRRGVETVVAFHYPGDLIGTSGLDDPTYLCTITLLERSGVCEIPLSRLNRMIDESSEIRHGFIHRLARELSKARCQCRWITHASAEGRVAGFLLESSERMSQLRRRPELLHLAMSRHDIASYLGLASETVSRVLKAFEADGLVTISGKEIEVLDFDRLRARAYAAA